MKSFFHRGGVWVLMQSVLLVNVILLAAFFRGGGFHPAVVIAGAALLIMAAGISLAGALALGRNLTPFPKPGGQAQLVRHGIYAVIRHPLYASVMAGAIGWALVWQSWPALVVAAFLIPFFLAKSRREERWLRDKFPEYADYERKVRGFVPSCHIDPPPSDSRYFQTAVAGVLMHAVEMGEQTDGSRPVFVLVHGLGMSSRYLLPTGKLLSVLGEVYVPDLPGFGKSGKPSRIPNISELADSLGEWMTANEITSPVLLGNSMGAQVIVDFAARHRTRLTAAVLVGPTIDPEARRMSTQIWRLLTDVPREPPSLYGIAVTDYFRAGVGRCLQTLRHALNDPITEKLPAIRVPVLVVRGEHDPIVPQRWTEQAAGLVPVARCVTIPRAAHAVNFSAPEALVKEVMKFMEWGGETGV